MRGKTGLVLTTLLLALSASLAAQKPGVFEVGVFGRYTEFDGVLNFDSRVGIGGRLGVFVLPNLAVEGDASYTATASADQDFVRAIPLHARLVYNVPLGAHSAVLVGGGYTRQLFRAEYRETKSGGGGLLGLRLGMGDVLSIRLDATADYLPKAESEVPQFPSITAQQHNWHWGGQAGLSLLVGAKRDGDKDKDGVKDSLDQCPNTPLGEAVDATGCSLPKDADGDGVTDLLDRCPNTPAGTPVDATGCPRDSDGDGVTDLLDQCPNTPAGTTVDARGCPFDADGDGVIDSRDKCPNTPAGTRVDAVGCPALFGGGATLVLEGVYFETGKATLKPESQAVLTRVAESLKGNPEVTVEIGGHTDNTGSKATNRRLSAARANAVRDYLISQGVDAGRMTAKGYGPDKPVAANTTVAGRAANRRVELTKTN